MYECCREMLKKVEIKPGTTTAGKGKEEGGKLTRSGIL